MLQPRHGCGPGASVCQGCGWKKREKKKRKEGRQKKKKEGGKKERREQGQREGGRNTLQMFVLIDQMLF